MAVDVLELELPPVPAPSEETLDRYPLMNPDYDWYFYEEHAQDFNEAQFSGYCMLCGVERHSTRQCQDEQQTTEIARATLARQYRGRLPEDFHDPVYDHFFQTNRNIIRFDAIGTCYFCGNEDNVVHLSRDCPNNPFRGYVVEETLMYLHPELRRYQERVRVRVARSASPQQRKALRLLRSLLTPSELAHYKRKGFIRVVTKDENIYDLYPRTGHAEEMEQVGKVHRIRWSFCLHSRSEDMEDDIPPADETIGHYLLLKTDEAEFRDKANATMGDWLLNRVCGDYVTKHYPELKGKERKAKIELFRIYIQSKNLNRIVNNPDGVPPDQRPQLDDVTPEDVERDREDRENMLHAYEEECRNLLLWENNNSNAANWPMVATTNAANATTTYTMTNCSIPDWA